MVEVFIDLEDQSFWGKCTDMSIKVENVTEVDIKMWDKNWKNMIIWLIKAGIAGCVALAFLSVVSIFYDYTGVHIASETGATDYRWESNQWRATMTEGFVWTRMDQNGYNNAKWSEKEKIDILLMGSSHMEALNVEPTKNTAYRLNELLMDFYTYNIGISGHTIYHCVNNLNNAVHAYNPSKYVIIETDRVALETSEMQHVIDQDFARIPSYESGALYYLQKYIPAVKIIFKKISEWNGLEENMEDLNDICTEEIAQPEAITREYNEILQEFLALAASSLNQDQKLIIFYQPLTQIRADGSFVIEDGEAVKQFAQTCENSGITFIDMTQDFKTMYEERHILAHGFSNTKVGSGHLNSYGHEAIAQRLASVIREENRKVAVGQYE